MSANRKKKIEDLPDGSWWEEDPLTGWLHYYDEKDYGDSYTYVVPAHAWLVIGPGFDGYCLAASKNEAIELGKGYYTEDKFLHLDYTEEGSGSRFWGTKKDPLQERVILPIHAWAIINGDQRYIRVKLLQSKTEAMRWAVRFRKAWMAANV